MTHLHLKEEFGSVKYEGKQINLLQQPYHDLPAMTIERPYYKAAGIDSYGNQVIVKWYVKEYWLTGNQHEYEISDQLEDETEACDWSNPFAVEIIQLAAFDEVDDSIYFKHKCSGIIKSLNEWKRSCHHLAMLDWSYGNINRSDYNDNVLQYISSLLNDADSFYEELVECDEKGNLITKK